MKNAPGTTLLELTLTLCVIGIMCGMALPAARHALDVVQVRSVREMAFGVAMRARGLAIAHGGAQLIIDDQANTLTAMDANGAVAERTWFGTLGVRVSYDGVGAGPLILRYDALGIGSMTSRTVRFRRHDVEAGLTISSYGRVRRW